MTLSIIYSFNKRGFEADFWTREIAAASNERVRFIPFNHDPYLPTLSYIRAQLLDNQYYDRQPGLMRMYDDVRALAAREQATVLLVDNCFPYHPEWLRTFDIYKVLRTSDGPLTAYERDFAYVHAYDHVLYHSPAYSRDIDMREKLQYVGAKRVDFWPLAVWDAAFDQTETEETTFARKRDVDVVFVGAPYRNKLPAFARVKKALGKRLAMYGFSSKHNLYFNARYGMPGWVNGPIPFGREFIDLYQRAKIGFNVHNRGDYTVGSYRMFELPANGVMQISDGGRHLGAFFEEGREIVGYRDVDDMIDKIRYYLDHDDERVEIARNAYRRVMRDHRIGHRLLEAARLIEEGMAR
jgi:glycosyltransferase involved in cell wall biosynthesis